MTKVKSIKSLPFKDLKNLKHKKVKLLKRNGEKKLVARLFLLKACFECSQIH